MAAYLCCEQCQTHFKVGVYEVRTGQESQLQLDPQLQVPEEAHPQLPMMNDKVCVGYRKSKIIEIV